MISTIQTGHVGTGIHIGRDHTHLATSVGGAHVFEAESGLFAIEGGVEQSKRRVVEFLAPGELISDRVLGGFGAVRFRAIEAGTLRRYLRTEWLQDASRDTLAGSLEAAAARIVIANAIIGIADIDQRVASFLGAISLRLATTRSPAAPVDVPLSRDDVASHIQINPDTLSRCYSRLRARQLVTRSGQSRLVVLDLPALLAASPIADLIERTFTAAVRTAG